jgi:hypothetical protein
VDELAGFAEYHPVAGNDSAIVHVHNRRVDLVIMPRTTVDLSMPEGSSKNANWHKIAG